MSDESLNTEWYDIGKVKVYNKWNSKVEEATLWVRFVGGEKFYKVHEQRVCLLPNIRQTATCFIFNAETSDFLLSI